MVLRKTSQNPRLWISGEKSRRSALEHFRFSRDWRRKISRAIQRVGSEARSGSINVPVSRQPSAHSAPESMPDSVARAIADRHNEATGPDWLDHLMDHVTTEKRSEIMRAVRPQDSGPEMTVRRLLHKRGYRYRLHGKDLPGSPDIVFRPRKKAVFVHGCFWHGHHGCRKARLPKSRADYWRGKIEKNRDRDRRNMAALENIGWRAVVIWQCELRDINKVQSKLISFLESNDA